MFLIQCDNKGCGKSSQAVIDTTDNEVYCAECDKSIKNVTIFSKNQLKNLRQIRRPKKEAFSVKCASCSTEATPKLISDKLLCAKCGVELINIPKPFQILIKQSLIGKAKEEAEEKKNI